MYRERHPAYLESGLDGSSNFTWSENGVVSDRHPSRIRLYKTFAHGDCHYRRTRDQSDRRYENRWTRNGVTTSGITYTTNKASGISDDRKTRQTRDQCPTHTHVKRPSLTVPSPRPGTEPPLLSLKLVGIILDFDACKLAERMAAASMVSE